MSQIRTLIVASILSTSTACVSMEEESIEGDEQLASRSGEMHATATSAVTSGYPQDAELSGLRPGGDRPPDPPHVAPPNAEASGVWSDGSHPPDPPHATAD